MRMPEDDFANNLNWRSRSACMGGSVTPQIMGAQFDPDHLARLVDHYSGSVVGDRENTPLRFNVFFSDIFSESVCNFLRDVYDLGFSATFWLRQCDFAVFDINRSDLQHLPDSHAALGHQFHHEPVTWIGGSENDLINQVFFNDFPLLRTAGPEHFPQYRRVAGILDLKVDGISDVIEEGLEARIAVSFGGLFGSFGESGQKGQNFIRGDGFQFPVTEFIFETGKKKIMVFQRIFFSNWPCDTLDTNG
jgi:hypothetical protein